MERDSLAAAKTALQWRTLVRQAEARTFKSVTMLQSLQSQLVRLCGAEEE